MPISGLPQASNFMAFPIESSKKVKEFKWGIGPLISRKAKLLKKSKPDSSTSYIYVDSDAAMVMQL